MATVGKRSKDLERVLAKLEKVEEGTTVPWKDLVGQDHPSERQRGLVQRARYILRDERTAVFHAVCGVGIKRATPPEILNGLSRISNAIRRKADIADREARVADQARLTEDERIALRVECGCFAMQGRLSQRETREFLGGRIIQNGILRVGDVLKLTMGDQS